MAPKIQIYGIPPSAPCRVVYLTCHVLGLDYEVTPIKPWHGDHKTPEFLKVNPHHTIPVMIDGDFKLDESRPCALYLVEKYGKDSKLMPENAEDRARVFHDLFFDMGTYYKASIVDCALPVIFMGAKEVPPEKLAKLQEVLGFMNEKVKKTGFASGTDHLTLSDLSYLATTSTLVACGITDLPKELNDWFVKCKALVPDYEKANGAGAEEFGKMFKTKSFK